MYQKYLLMLHLDEKRHGMRLHYHHPNTLSMLELDSFVRGFFDETFSGGSKSHMFTWRVPYLEQGEMLKFFASQSIDMSKKSPASKPKETISKQPFRSKDRKQTKKDRVRGEGFKKRVAIQSPKGRNQLRSPLSQSSFFDNSMGLTADSMLTNSTEYLR